MRKKIHLCRLLSVIASVFLVAMAGLSPAAASQGTGTNDLISNTIRRMTLGEKVGQLFVTFAYGDTVDTVEPTAVAANRQNHGVDNAKQLIESYHLGGIIYFAWAGNTANPRQIAGLSNGIQRVAMHQRTPIPMLISTDQEYGVVYRVGEPATQFPGNMALGAARDAEPARTAAEIGGRELRAMGINQDFAPVADVNINPLNPVIGVRSYSEDPRLAAHLAAAQVTGYQRGGVSATAKHFPGHGDTTVDSHTGIPVIAHGQRDWQRLDAPPFKAAIARGIDAIMTAHIVVPALDPSGDPATLSKPIITGILREKLGYDGLVITDALGMAGVRQKYGDERIPVLALKAGVDQLLKPVDIDLAYNAVLKAVRDGELSERRIDESVSRVLRLKQRRGLFANPYVDPARLTSVVGTARHKRVAQSIADRTTTLVRNEGLLPLATRPAVSCGTPAPGRPGHAEKASHAPASVSCGTPAPGRPGHAEKASHAPASVVFITGADPAPQRLAEAIGQRGATTSTLQTGSNPSQAVIDSAVARAGAAGLTVVTTGNAWANAGQRNLVKALLGTGKPVVVIAIRDPYDIAYFPEAKAYLATYSYTGISLESAVRVLYGEIRPRGKLPVTIPVAGDPSTPLYPFGHGLSWSG